MASKAIYFVLLVVALSLVVENAEAGWKFWKKKKTEEPTTTVAPGVPGEAVAGQSAGGANPPVAAGSPAGSGKNSPVSSPAGAAKPRGEAPGSPSSGTRGAIAGAANPGLAIGVGSTGTDIRNNARPQRPNPGTDVGLDISGPRPARPGTGGQSGQGYRDWAADLTGAGEGSRQPPKVPSQGPALTGHGGQQQPSSGPRPGSPVSPVSGQTPNANNRQNPPALGPRPGSPTSSGGVPTQQGGQVSPGQGNRPLPASNNPAAPNSQPTATSGGNQVSTLHVGSLKPGQSRPGSPSSVPGSPTSGSSGYGSPGSLSPPSSPTGGKSWAEVAGSGGNARPASPTPAPRPLQPVQPRPGAASGGRPTGLGGPSGQPTSGQPAGSGQPTSGQPAGSGHGVRTGAAIAGGAAVGAAAAAGGKTYSSNPTYSKGNGVTDEDLEKLAEALFIKDTNNANRYITVNLQKQTNGNDKTDQAPQPRVFTAKRKASPKAGVISASDETFLSTDNCSDELFTVNSQALQIPTIAKVVQLYDNYKLDTRVNEYISPAQRNEESLLVDTFLSTNVMSTAMRFLADKAFVRKDYYEYKDTLRRMWFNLYSRGDGKIGSAGFEHVFLTELKLGNDPEVSGLHNWIYFNAEEVAKRADYLGYIKKVDLGDKASILKIHAKHSNIDKPVTTMFVGTSPELEMALYTVCFFARPERACPVSLGGTKFNIITHKFRYRGKDLIGSAYPDI